MKQEVRGYLKAKKAAGGGRRGWVCGWVGFCVLKRVVCEWVGRRFHRRRRRCRVPCVEARAVLARCGAKRVGGAEYTVADLADLRDACAAANTSVADRVRPESARNGIYKAGVEFALDAAALRTSTSMIGPPTKFLSGLAEDIGVAPGKAGRVVSAGLQ